VQRASCYVAKVEWRYFQYTRKYHHLRNVVWCHKRNTVEENNEVRIALWKYDNAQSPFFRQYEMTSFPVCNKMSLSRKMVTSGRIHGAIARFIHLVPCSRNLADNHWKIRRVCAIVCTTGWYRLKDYTDDMRSIIWNQPKWRRLPTWSFPQWCVLQQHLYYTYIEILKGKPESYLNFYANSERFTSN